MTSKSHFGSKGAKNKALMTVLPTIPNSCQEKKMVKTQKIAKFKNASIFCLGKKVIFQLSWQHCLMIFSKNSVYYVHPYQPQLSSFN